LIVYSAEGRNRFYLYKCKKEYEQTEHTVSLAENEASLDLVAVPTLGEPLAPIPFAAPLAPNDTLLFGVELSVSSASESSVFLDEKLASAFCAGVREPPDTLGFCADLGPHVGLGVGLFLF